MRRFCLRGHPYAGLFNWEVNMTQEQKEIIIAKRSAGVAYGKIAQALGLSVNTVKSFCQRNNMSDVPVYPVHTVTDVAADDSNTHLCRYCGKPIEQIPGRRERRYCSAVCCTRWWGKYGAARNHRHPAVCQHCGKTFYGRPGRKYCSHACYIEERFGAVHDA